MSSGKAWLLRASLMGLKVDPRDRNITAPPPPPLQLRAKAYLVGLHCPDPGCLSASGIPVAVFSYALWNPAGTRGLSSSRLLDHCGGPQ